MDGGERRVARPTPGDDDGVMKWLLSDEQGNVQCSILTRRCGERLVSEPRGTTMPKIILKISGLSMPRLSIIVRSRLVAAQVSTSVQGIWRLTIDRSVA